jgi:hypothetical protein
LDQLRVGERDLRDQGGSDGEAGDRETPCSAQE